ncbi:DUF5606 family protein [Williamwhitmania taraxaci]|uniref:Uncharacterized protein n=1 Tax=Williamwhitmania taraxaci TaxID=1640674 RepID=A0A1G6R5E3_9BACT|nr:DUF5606 domain-containing protein [Williamwhitmania taraxaci]SDC99832.1 hypothetical protein SAMN05216323_10705 [Williamwhitmania taraxaci]
MSTELNLKKIISISGQPGLFQFVSQSRNGIIVESLLDQKRMNASASAKVSSLGDIAVYTETGEAPLRDVLKNIRTKENGGQALSGKATNDQLKAYLLEVLPDYDSDKVYASDIKKMVSWYNLLQSKDMLALLDIEEEANEATAEADKAE